MSCFHKFSYHQVGEQQRMTTRFKVLLSILLFVSILMALTLVWHSFWWKPTTATSKSFDSNVTNIESMDDRAKMSSDKLVNTIDQEQFVQLNDVVGGETNNLSPNINNNKQLDQTSLSAKANNIKCHDLVPGIERMSHGVDITGLDLFPSDILKSNGFRNALFDFSCNHKHTWRHPNIDDYQFNRPDQIMAISSVPASALTIRTSFNQNLKQCKESLALQVDIDVSVCFGGFSSSVGYKEAKEQIMKSNKSIAESSAYVSAIQIDFESSRKMQPNDNFQKYLDEFPAKYEDNPSLYQKFIDSFGTHYFESAKFGGYLYQKTVIENSYIYKADMKEIAASVKAKLSTFFVSASVGVEVKTSSSSINEEFNSNSETHFSHYGGKADLTNFKEEGSFSKWVDSVYKDPWLFAGKLEPIENLIANLTVRAQVKKAISVYRAKAFLADFRSTIYLGRITLTEQQLQYLATIENYLYNPQAGQYDLNKIGQDIDDLFERVQEIRDRALLKEVHETMQSKWNSTFKCKYWIGIVCNTGPVSDKLQKEKEIWDYLTVQKIAKVLKQTARPDSAQHLSVRIGARSH